MTDNKKAAVQGALMSVLLVFAGIGLSNVVGFFIKHGAEIFCPKVKP